jgi:hypothetical protein
MMLVTHSYVGRQSMLRAIKLVGISRGVYPSG